jgi:hypothetical protein
LAAHLPSGGVGTLVYLNSAETMRTSSGAGCVMVESIETQGLHCP